MNHNDAAGNPLAPDDRVMFIGTEGYSGPKRLIWGTVLRFAPKTVIVRYDPGTKFYGGTEKAVPPANLVKPYGVTPVVVPPTNDPLNGGDMSYLELYSAINIFGNLTSVVKIGVDGVHSIHNSDVGGNGVTIKHVNGNQAVVQWTDIRTWDDL